MSGLAQHAAALLDYAKSVGYIDSKCDAASGPFLQALREQEPTVTEHHFIEWQGALEFDLLAVFWYDNQEDDDPHCLNCTRDGKITVCN